MLGVIYSAVSDFSVFSYPRPLYTSVVCHDVHKTPIEERYCAKQHVHYCDDEEWEELLARGVQLFDESEPDFLVTPEVYHEDEKNFEKKEGEEEEITLIVPPPTPISTFSASSTPSLMGSQCLSISGDSSGDDSEYEDAIIEKTDLCTTAASAIGITNKRKRKRGKVTKTLNTRKRLCRASSNASVSTLSSIASARSSSSSSSLFIESMLNSENPWKCPHCPWIQHTQRLPDFLRHQRSHFVSQSDWPCPNPACGKGFARKDSLKRHLDNRSTGCKRPPGYKIC
ncbi:hypothetical protein EW145_g6033 [Phellinidium pouzarii]|uniref:C2H2-type domain-containing protein n=1 Tax=Phellinidium pouzarii TaxID=167371 RepID=A0A4S4KY00_9AGAM|nr:hypothetical protein EW145_g6033 [Phellinidium pouzarii]